MIFIPQRLSVDISSFIMELLGELVYVLELSFNLCDEIIILKGDIFGLDFDVTFLDFLIGVLVMTILLGGLLRLNKADNYYYKE